MIIEHKQQRLFSSLLPATLGDLADYYTPGRESMARIAGITTVSVVLLPKDDLRYRHQFWIDPQSGLVLKAARFNEQGDVLESFVFTDLKIGGRFEREAGKIRRKTVSADWRVETVSTREALVDGGEWQFSDPLPGFKRVASMHRQIRTGVPEGRHYVFSDGLSAISVFIEPLAGRTVNTESAAMPMGAVNVYKRVIGDFQLVVMGEVPPQAVRRLGDGIEQKK